MQKTKLSMYPCLTNNTEKTAVMRFFVKNPLKRINIETLTHQTKLSSPQLIQTIEHLKQEGLNIHSYGVNQYYYEPNEKHLHPDVISCQLNTQWWGHQMHTFDEINSTIDMAKSFISHPKSHGRVCIAEYQHQGRGRQGNPWLSQKGNDILMTFILELNTWNPSPALMSLYAAVAVARVLDTAYNLPIKIKWPNDIIAQGKKLGGVLVELDHLHRIVLVSLGLNVHSQPSNWPEHLRGQSTSLIELNPTEEWQRTHLLAQCGTTWEGLWETTLRDHGEAIRGYWKRYSTTLYKHVQLQRRGRLITGVTQGIDELGRLIFTAADGTKYHLLVEEVQHLRVIG